jgi:hypothetical protein
MTSVLLPPPFYSPYPNCLPDLKENLQMTLETNDRGEYLILLHQDNFHVKVIPSQNGIIILTN